MYQLGQNVALQTLNLKTAALRLPKRPVVKDPGVELQRQLSKIYQLKLQPQDPYTKIMALFNRLGGGGRV